MFIRRSSRFTPRGKPITFRVQVLRELGNAHGSVARLDVRMKAADGPASSIVRADARRLRYEGRRLWCLLQQ